MPPTPQATAAPLVPDDPDLDRLRDAAAGCHACPLWKLGTQTVFGAGSDHPSSILRAPDEGARQAEYRAFVVDLSMVAEAMRSS